MKNRPFILCADDLQMNQIMMTEMLEKYFYVECINNDGGECLEVISNRRPDLILLGESMPIRDENELCKMLREEGQYREIPIVSLFAKNDSGVTIEHDYDLHLSDPFDEELLIASINRLLER